jgi:hypothetical protein
MEDHRGSLCLNYCPSYFQLNNFFLYKKVSDDEDDTHPNIDTPSLFRWRHQARVERMQETEKEKADLEKTKKQ